MTDNARDKAHKGPLLLVRMKAGNSLGMNEGTQVRATEKELKAHSLVNGKDYEPQGTYPADAGKTSNLAELIKQQEEAERERQAAEAGVEDELDDVDDMIVEDNNPEATEADAL